jgi:GntR family transcriptional regulator
MNSPVSISQADRRPMYLQIMEQIRHRVAVGDWPPGQEIPSIRALAVAAQVSVITVKRAYLELEREGVIVTRQGKGSFVADTVDLSATLRHQELDDHVAKVVTVGRQLGLTDKQIEKRVQDALHERGTQER